MSLSDKPKENKTYLGRPLSLLMGVLLVIAGGEADDVAVSPSESIR